MTPFLGIIAAFGAFIFWGFGDFAIQRSIRAVGTLQTLFWICALAAILMLPFVWGSFHEINIGRDIIILLAASVIGLVTATLNFESFKRGKLAVIEPVMSFELVLTVLIGVLIIGERISVLQGVLIATVFGGILLTIVQRQTVSWWKVWLHRRSVEKGVVFAAIGAVGMAGSNVLTGIASQSTTPLFAVWFTHTVIAVLLLCWFVYRKAGTENIRQAVVHWRIIFSATLLDTIAWIAFATAVLTIPISVTIGITESYVVLAVLLGIFVNKERVHAHQLVGGAVAFAAGITLAIISI